MTTVRPPIEVDLPIREISEHSLRDKRMRSGHIKLLHMWWARRPLPACRADTLAALLPDPDALQPNDAFVERAAAALEAWADEHPKLAGPDLLAWSRVLRTEGGVDTAALHKALLAFV